MLDQSQGWHNRIGWGKGKPSDQALPPTKAETKSRKPLERMCPSEPYWSSYFVPAGEEDSKKCLPPYPLMDYGGQANGNRPRTRTDWLADPFILDSLGSEIDETNQKCKSRKRGKQTAAQRLGLVPEEFWAWATTHAAARTHNSRRGHQPPESL